MNERKSFLPILALIFAILALGVSVFSLLRPAQADDSGLEVLKTQNAQLQAQLDALNARLDTLGASSGVAKSTLTAKAWESGSGADVTMTAVPGAYEDGMTAAFSVRLAGQEVRNVPCEWDGTRFSATADLEAVDGYSYYCILTAADGTHQQFALSTPENPVEDIPVYLKSSLSAYCNMTMDSWLDADGMLTVSLAYAQAQLPRLSVSGEMPGVASARLMLTYHEETFSEAALTLEPGEGPGAYELTISGVELTLPEGMVEEDYLDLFLEVELTDGQVLSALGGSWYYSEGSLFFLAG